MSSYSTIVVGTDGSDAAHGAIVVTGVIGASLAVPVTAVTAWRAHVEVPGARELDWAERTTLAADVELTAAGVKQVSRVEVKGDPADSLLEVAGGEPATLIVVGAKGLDKAPRRI